MSIRTIPYPRPWTLAALLLVLTGSGAAQENQDGGRTLRWREIAVAARLDADGRLHVEERQAMVFDGAWNGGERGFDLRLGQDLRLNGVVRIDPATGARIPLTRSDDLEGVDEYDREGNTVRWRSRLASDPPFQNREIVYELDYSIGPAVFRAEDGRYRLVHDFTFADRAGVIERFDVELVLDPAWSSPSGNRIREGADRLAPGRGYVLDVTLDHVAPGEPAEVAVGAPSWARGVAAGGALLVPLFVLFGLRRRQRELDEAAPITPPEEIDESWLREHVFAHPPEVVGASWDRSIGAAEVAALLARLVGEGKLTSRVETGDGDPVLHLRRVAPLDRFSAHERELLAALFYHGGDETDTASIREHYRKEGFDPAAKVRPAISDALDRLPGAGRVRRRPIPAIVLAVGGIGLALSEAGRPGGALLAILGVVGALTLGLAALAFAYLLSRRVTHRAGPSVGLLSAMVVMAAGIAFLAGGPFERDGGMLFYRPGTPLLLGLLGMAAGVGLLAVRLARPGQTPERLAFRRRLVSAREYFEAELSRAEPRLQDAWFPYLLAFGLGGHVDRWFREFGGSAGSGSAPAIVAGGAAAGRGSSSAGARGGWSGGGVQFGGGSWGGGGAGGTWGVAAAGLAAGVSPPSSSGGGGASASGGGSGGGW